MGKLKQDKSIKEFSLTDQELSELSFYDQILKTKEIEMRAFYVEKMKAENIIYKRLGINAEDYIIDNHRIYSTGKLFVQKRPKPIVKTEEAKPDESPGK